MHVFTFEAGLVNARRAVLAFDAGYFEHAYINADDACAVFEWKGAQDEPCFGEADGIRTAAADKISSERLEEMRAIQDRAKKAVLSRRNHDFVQRAMNERPWLWRKTYPFGRRSRIGDRPR